jgi:hypothetical protein
MWRRTVPLVDVEVGVKVGSQTRRGRRVGARRLQVEVVSGGRLCGLIHAHVPKVEAAEVVGLLVGIVVESAVVWEIPSAAPCRRLRPHCGER